MGRQGVRQLNFAGPRPEVLPPPAAAAGPSSSHLRAWNAFKAQRGIGLSGEITIADLRTFAAFLLSVDTPRGVGFSSTAQYVDSAVAAESELGTIKNVLFLRQLSSLKRSIARHLKREQRVPHQAPPVLQGGLGQLPRRQQLILLVACSLGLRSDTLAAVERHHVWITPVRGSPHRARKVGVDVRKDKCTMLRRVEVVCSCDSGAGFCVICSVTKDEWVSLFPIPIGEVAAACRAVGTSLHGPRRTCALGARRVYDAEPDAARRQKIFRETNARQGWSNDAAAPSFFRYSQDVEAMEGQALMTVWLPTLHLK